jgi:hypothetical protein
MTLYFHETIDGFDNIEVLFLKAREGDKMVYYQININENVEEYYSERDRKTWNSDDRTESLKYHHLITAEDQAKTIEVLFECPMNEVDNDI